MLACAASALSVKHGKVLNNQVHEISIHSAALKDLDGKIDWYIKYSCKTDLLLSMLLNKKMSLIWSCQKYITKIFFKNIF